MFLPMDFFFFFLKSTTCVFFLNIAICNIFVCNILWILIFKPRWNKVLLPLLVLLIPKNMKVLLTVVLLQLLLSSPELVSSVRLHSLRLCSNEPGLLERCIVSHCWAVVSLQTKLSIWIMCIQFYFTLPGGTETSNITASSLFYCTHAFSLLSLHIYELLWWPVMVTTMCPEGTPSMQLKGQ